jgi:spermidine/putrescine transport system substrate-binding protein
MPFITKADSANPAIYPPEDLMRKLGTLVDVGAASELYDQVWTAVKSR